MGNATLGIDVVLEVDAVPFAWATGWTVSESIGNTEVVVLGADLVQEHAPGIRRYTGSASSIAFKNRTLTQMGLRPRAGTQQLIDFGDNGEKTMTVRRRSDDVIISKMVGYRCSGTVKSVSPGNVVMQNLNFVLLEEREPGS